MNNFKKSLIGGVFSLMLLISSLSPSWAASISAEDLISNCQELIAIYDRRGDRKLIAGISTSVAEAMRAGICRGMIDEHLNHSNCRNGWHTIASSIAEKDGDVDIEKMLDQACYQ